MKKNIFKSKFYFKTKILTVATFLFLLNFLSVLAVYSQSTVEFKNSIDTLVVYKDVPGLAPSDKYTIRVRSSATNGEWVDVFANFTVNKADPKSTELNSPDRYQVNCAAWTHAYGNIEMNNGQVVEVEIAGKPGFKIAGKDFEKAKVHPAQKASVATLVDGKIYFTITKPGQIYIDINGQMDDYNRAINPIGHPVHVVTLFANPVIKKPSLNDLRVLAIETGTNLATINAINPASYDIMYFKPGVHDIASGIKMHPGKTIYIPGDAFIFGSFNNYGVSAGSNKTNGEKITLYGYGTICGEKIPHYQSTLVYDPVIIVDGDKPIEIENPQDCKISGVTLTDNANHSIEINGTNNSIKWLKTISWRVNGDGLGGYTDAEDCFIRAHDDASYVKASKRRCTFWKDSNARLFFMAAMPENTVSPIIIEDCDVLYARLRVNPGGNGGGFTAGGGPSGQRKVNLIVRDIRFHDKLVNMSVFNLNSSETGSSYNGILFQNISIAGMAPRNKQKILGSATSPWYGGLIFDNLTIGGTLITNENYTTYFETNEFVKDIWFRMPQYFTITKNANAAQGVVIIESEKSTYIENSAVTLTASALAGFEFSGWTGDIVSTTNPLSIVMDGNKTITATFNAVGTKTLTTTPSINGTISISPTGSSQTTNSTATLTAKPAIGYKFASWTGDVASNTIVTTVKMDADKTVSANFVKTNNFAVNYGGDQYIAADGTVFAQTPNSFTRANAIANTTDDFIYQSEIFGKTISLDYPVDNGNYTVVLKFAEVFHSVAGRRIFNVAIEDNPVLTNFDIFAEAGANNTALDKTYQVTVADGTLNLKFTAVADNAKINAVVIKNTDGLSIMQTNLNNTISIYPNPATDKLFFSSSDKQINKIEIVDLTGKIVHTSTKKSHDGSLDLTGIAKGFYLVKIQVDNAIFTKKITLK